MLIADQREAPHTPLSNPLRKVFGPLSTMPITDQREAHDSFKCSRLPPRRFALLPFALLLELSAPVPVGVLHFNRGCHLGAELIRLPSLAHDRSAAPTQSPELGDSQQQKPLLSSHLQQLCVPQRLIYFPCRPQPMQQYCQLSCHSYNRPLFRSRATAGGQLQSPSLQIRVGSLTAQNVMRSLHQQRT